MFESDRALCVVGRKPEEYGIAGTGWGGFPEAVIDWISVEGSRKVVTINHQLDLAT